MPCVGHRIEGEMASRTCTPLERRAEMVLGAVCPRIHVPVVTGADSLRSIRLQDKQGNESNFTIADLQCPYNVFANDGRVSIIKS